MPFLEGIMKCIKINIMYKLENILRTTRRTFFVLLLFLPFAVLGQGSALSNKQLNVFTLGDSNGTFPYSWPQQLKLALPNAQVFNISRSGRTIGFLNLGDSTLNSLFVIDENLKKATDFTKDRPFAFFPLRASHKSRTCKSGVGTGF